MDRRTLKLRKELDAGEVEINQRKRTLNVMKLIKDKGDIKIVTKIEDLDHQCEYLEVLNQTLVLKERECHDELVEARKVLLDVSFQYRVSSARLLLV